MFTRRNFLRALATGAAVGVVAPAALVELLAPKRTIFLPPRGGWAAGLPPLKSFYFQTHTQYSARVPQFLVNYVDPKMLEILVQPMQYELILEGYDASEPFESDGGILA